MTRQLIDDLIDKPLNELTEEEAQIVIEWKANKQFKKMQTDENSKRVTEEMKQRIEAYKEEAEAAKETLDELKERALAFYEQQ